MTATLIPNLTARPALTTTVADEIDRQWQTRVAAECAQQTEASQASIVNWLLGEDRQRLETLEPRELQIARQAMDYQWRILSQRYLGLPPTRAYKHLMQRLGGVAVLGEQIRAWIAQSSDCQRTVVDVLQEIIQELLQSDRYIQQQLAWIGKCTQNPRLRDALLFASVEEYCLRPIRNRPLIAYRFVNYLRRSQSGGVTSIAKGELVKLVSDEVIANDDSTWSLLDDRSQEEYLQQQAGEEIQVLRENVKAELRDHLVAKLGTEAGVWLDLYLQGQTPEAIAQAMGLPIQHIYRLRENIKYQAAKVFGMKDRSELVAQWLQISLTEHNFGLTASQWDNLCGSLAPLQLQILTSIKAGSSIEQIARLLHMRTNEVFKAWSQVYLVAQSLRTNS
ncbi:hypothetical protein C7B77_09260 [Chamaesiphon polymorphus CCALA 037]|uniref:HetZ-related protein 2 n=2 Tax=Chamaesiphon TaxID=217161 RepID=A0A2T1GHN7_9CYAN|nr:hypothetical protein C7B77_09260 [Chamaesiphon polymorphus CCALA 037]